MQNQPMNPPTPDRQGVATTSASNESPVPGHDTTNKNLEELDALLARLLLQFLLTERRGGDP